jgi:NUMOD3 motif
MSFAIPRAFGAAMNNSDYYIYALFRETGEPFYIGKGRKRRWDMHEWHARRGDKGRRFAIIRSMFAQGLGEVPKAKLHEGLTASIASDYEIALIAAIGRYPHGPLVNQSAGGEGCGNPSDEVRARKAAAMRGQKRAPETCAKIGDIHRGKTVSMEARAKLRLANLGKKQTPEHIANMIATKIGKKHPPGTGEKIRASLLGRQHTPERRANQRAARLAYLERQRTARV